MEHYTIHVNRELLPDGSIIWKAWHPAIEGCRSYGNSPDEAVENLGEARAMILSDLKKSGLPVPPGDTNIKHAVIYVH